MYLSAEALTLDELYTGVKMLMLYHFIDLFALILYDYSVKREALIF